MALTHEEEKLLARILTLEIARINLQAATHPSTVLQASNAKRQVQSIAAKLGLSLATENNTNG